MARIVFEYESSRGTVDLHRRYSAGTHQLKEGIAMKKLLIPVLALGLLGSAAAVTAPAPAKAAAVVVKIGGGGGHHHRRHVCSAWGSRHHVRYCRVWRWRYY
jgi:hypothetical protein